MGFIYKITNKINGKGYVGVTMRKDPKERWRQHELCAKRDNGCPLLSAAIVKHGIENFKFEVLIICFDEDVFHYEVDYIAKYKTLAPAGYNSSVGGKFGNGFKGHKHSEETKKHLAKTSKEINNSPEMRKAQSERLKKYTQQMHEAKRKKKEAAINKLIEEGMTQDEAVKQIKAQYAFLYERSKETNKKVSESLKKYYKTQKPEHREARKILMAEKLGKKIRQYSSDGTLLNAFPSVTQAAKDLNLARSTIQKCLKTEEKLAYGFRWELVESTPA